MIEFMTNKAEVEKARKKNSSGNKSSSSSKKKNNNKRVNDGYGSYGGYSSDDDLNESPSKRMRFEDDDSPYSNDNPYSNLPTLADYDEKSPDGSGDNKNDNELKGNPLEINSLSQKICNHPFILINEYETINEGNEKEKDKKLLRWLPNTLDEWAQLKKNSSEPIESFQSFSHSNKLKVLFYLVQYMVFKEKESMLIFSQNIKTLRVHVSPAIPRVFIHDQLFLCGVEF